MTKPQPSRRLWKAALGVVVLFAALGWLVAFPAYQRYRAIQEIERVDGVFIRETVGPQSLSQRDIELGRANPVDLGSMNITDDGHDRSSTLQEMHLHGTEFTANRWKRLRNLTNRRKLWLDDTLINDDGLKNLIGLTNLESLAIQNTKISGQGLMHLEGLANLGVLNLSHTQIDDSALRHLVGLTKIEVLALENTKIKGPGLVHLRSMRIVRVLNLSQCELDGESLSLLESLGEMRILYLKKTNIETRYKDKLKETISSLAIFSE